MIPQWTHSQRPKAGGLWIELTLANGFVVDGVLQTTDLLRVKPWKEITLLRGQVKRTYTRGSYTGIRVLGILGEGKWHERMKV